MGEDNQPSKKRAAGRELSRDNPGLDDDEEEVQEMGTFKKASEDVLAARKIVKVRRQQTSSAPSAPSTNPFAGICLVPPTAPAVAPAEAEAVEDKAGSEDADTKDGANSESEVKRVEPEEKTSKATIESNVDQVTEAPTEQETVVNQPDQAVVETTGGAAEAEAAEAKPSDERAADNSAEKTEGGTACETRADNDNNGKNENENPDASGSGGTPLSSFQQLSNSQNAFTGLTGTGFSTSTFSFGSLQKDSSPSQSSLPTFSFGNPTNGSTPVFGTVMPGTSIGAKPEVAAFRSMQEVPTETGEENEDTVFSADSSLFEFFDGGWKERGKGEVKLNLFKGESQKARLVMRTKGNLRLILNASIFPDMKLTKMDKKGITFACVNIATEGKDGLSTFALKFKDSYIMEEFSTAVSAYKDKPSIANDAATATATATATNTDAALKTPENSPKASDE